MSEKITVKIIDSYAFEHDRFGYTLFEVGKREKGVFGSPDKQQKTGELVDYKETVGYYSNVTSMLEACLKCATQKAAETAKVKSIGDYLEIMRNIADEIKSCLSITAF